MNLFASAISPTFRRVRAKAAGPRGAGLTAEVGRVVLELETLNRSTEHDFLAVGEQLARFQSLARRISSEMAELTGLISGEHGHKASQALAGMLDWATEMCDRTGHSGQSLSTVQSVSNRIRLSFAKLSETVAIFRALCPLTRIETARLGLASAGFHDLSDQIAPLSDSIQSSGKGVVEASSSLDRCIRSGIRNGAELSARQIKEVESLVVSVGESLRSFEGRQQRARDAAVGHAAQHAQVCAAIEDLVRAIQFHDITRQQIEHVCSALRQIGPADRGVVHLQSSQLRAAAESFAASIAHIEGDLGAIAARAHDMAESAQTLTAFSADEGQSFFSKMEVCFERILKAADSCAAGRSAIESTVSELTATIAAMQEAVEEIRAIEIQIQRIALNATIRSAHIGAPGDALNAIADVMHHVALDSSRNTEETAGLLDSMSGATGGISYGVRDTEGILGELRREISDLHASSESSFERVHRIAALGSELSAALTAARAELKVGPLFAEAVARARDALDRIEGDTATAPADLEEFARNYTMHAEREVHESVVRGEMVAVAVPEGHLGDNIELF